MGDEVSIQTIDGGRAPCPGLGTTCKTTKSLPVHPDPHRGEADGTRRHRSFGSNPAWRCDTDDHLLTLFISTFPLPFQQSWTVFHLNCKTVTHVIFALRMQPFVLEDWRRLPSPGKLVGDIGRPTSHLWDSIHI